MLNGLYISAMGMQVQEYRQSVTANNMANAPTAGFKRAIANVRARANAAVEDPRMAAYRQDQVYGKLSGGVWAEPTAFDWSQGTIIASSNRNDLALQGTGFFTVRNAAGEKLLTRNGKFNVGTEGDLVTASDGLKVLDADGQPIKVNPGLPLDVAATGEISQAGQKLASLGVVTINDPRGLEPIGGSAVRVRDGFSTKPADGSTQIKQGYVEQSGADPLTEMVSMMEGMRAFEANSRMVSMQDQMLSQLNTIGRVA